MMKRNLRIVMILVLAFSSAVAQANECARGALIGLLIGHALANHAMVGAVGGCIAAKKMAENKAQTAKTKEDTKAAAKKQKPESQNDV